MAAISLNGLTVKSTQAGATLQPWSDKTAYRYSVTVSTPEGEYQSYAYGSQKDYEDGLDDKEEEMAWMILRDLVSALDDPEEFWSMATGEPDLQSIDKARGILAVIDFANKISNRLEANREEIEAAYERF